MTDWGSERKGGNKHKQLPQSKLQKRVKPDPRVRARLHRVEAYAVLPYVNFCQSKIDTNVTINKMGHRNCDGLHVLVQ